MERQNNKKMDTVSVITTFYNAEKFIIQSVSSVNQQLVNGFELEYVIVDDKSPCNSRKMIEQFIKLEGNKKINFKYNKIPLKEFKFANSYDKYFICLSPEWVPPYYHSLFYTLLDCLNEKNNYQCVNGM